MEILFVCTGNTCRSPMAEGILKEFSRRNNLAIKPQSAGIFGIDGPICENSIIALEKFGLDISDYKSKPINSNMVENADLILTMSISQKEHILSHYPNSVGKVYGLKEYALGENKDIHDPYGKDLETYIKTRDEIYQAIKLFLFREGII